jgi:phosphonate transport system ATP-binding protein
MFAQKGKTGMNGIVAKNVKLGYGDKVVLAEVNLNIAKGEFISIIGPSGVGKSTLLMAINGNVKIFSGELTVLNQNLQNIKNAALKDIRSRIGVIFQGYNLVKRSSVLDNIAGGMLRKMNPLQAAVKYYRHDQYEQIYEYMRTVNLEGEALQRCDCLSGGQMQRVAIARALAQDPEVILADEPISSLDPVSAKGVMDTLLRINQQYGLTVIANLHQLEYAKRYCSRVIGMNGGRIVYDGKPEGLGQKLIDRLYQGSRDNSPVCGDELTVFPAAAKVVFDA